MTCQLCSLCNPWWHWFCFKVLLYCLALDSRCDGAELMREERSLVRDPLYTAVGEVAVTERTPEVSWRSVLQEDVETLVHLCWRCCSYRPHPACPHCADLVNRPSKRGFTQDTGCVLTLAWRYWLVALRSISPHTLRSASSCFKTWDNHKENWQCHSCSVISVIQPAAALLTKTVHSAALPSLLFSLCL